MRGSTRELTLATAFFAFLALLVVGLLRPLGPAEWICLLGSLGFVVIGCVTLWKGDALAAQRHGRPTADKQGLQATAMLQADRFGLDANVGEPSPEERLVLETTLAALEAADALAPGELDAAMLWQAAQHTDPGQPVGYLEALHSLAVLHELGRFRPRRLVFVPVQVEYDAALLAMITMSTLVALGHDVTAGDVSVTLPANGLQGEATITFLLNGRRETIACGFLWKYPPPDLFDALMGFLRVDHPRELVGADVSYGTLLLATIRPGSLDQLNLRFPVGYDMFGRP